MDKGQLERKKGYFGEIVENKHHCDYFYNCKVVYNLFYLCM